MAPNYVAYAVVVVTTFFPVCMHVRNPGRFCRAKVLRLESNACSTADQ